MTRAIRFGLLLVAAAIVFSDRAGARATASAAAAPQEPRASQAAPRVVTPGRHDVSPALRDIAPKPPRAGRDTHAPLRIRKPAKAPRQSDPALQTAAPSAVAPATILNFEGVDNIDSVLPPDTNGDIGPNHYVQWVNKSLAVYSRSGSLLYGPAAGNTVWAGFGGPCEAQNDGDPIVLYDHLADRWLLSQFALPNNFFGLLLAPFFQCIAVSQTPDPTGPYYRYQYEFQKLNDYPKFGVWPDGYYMAINQFSAVNLQFAGQGVAAFERAAMLAGQSARMIYFDLASVDPNLGGMLPSDLDGPPPPAGSPNYFAQMDDDAQGYSPDQVQLWRFRADWNVPSQSTFSGRVALPVAAFDSNLCDYARACIPQPGTTQRIDALSDRLMYRLQYRNLGTHESLVVNHTVDVDGNDHAGVRWYEIRHPGGTPVVYQQGTFAPDQFHRWMASAAMDAAGNLAIAYNTAGATLAPSIRYAARLASDAPGVLGLGENDLIAGTGSQTHTAGRWGDYSMLSVDPTDGCTFWATAEYIAVTAQAQWQTRIGAFRLPGCGEGGDPPPPPAPPPTVTIAATSATANEAGIVSGAFTIARAEASDAALSVAFAVSGTAVQGTDYQSLYSTATIPGGALSTTVAIVPINDSTIEPDETVVLSLASSPAYVIGTPSSATVTIVSDDRAVDFVVTSVKVPSAVAPGGTMNVTDVTKNQGTDPSPASVTSFFLSTNWTLDAGDESLGSRPVPELAPGATSSATTVLPVPGTLAAGSYVLFAKADGVLLISETNETNNARGVPLKVGPDLVVATLTASPSAAAAGGALAVTDSTKNQGASLAGESVTRFYWSVNAALDASDPPMGDRAVPALEAGLSSSATTAVTVPAGTAPGTYYLAAKADAGGSVAEHTETNNVRYAVVAVGPDLTVSSVSMPSSATAGSTISVTSNVKNKGGDSAGPSVTRFYLSLNATVDSSDIRLASEQAVGTLAPGAVGSSTVGVAIPAGLSGRYYFIAVADGDGAVAESNERNNVLARAITIAQ